MGDRRRERKLCFDSVLSEQVRPVTTNLELIIVSGAPEIGWHNPVACH